MADKHEYDAFVLQFAPYAARTDHVSIGVVMVGRSASPPFAEVRFVSDWRAVQCMRPDVDLEYLEALKREIADSLAAGGDLARVMKMLQESFSNGIRMSAGAPLTTDDPVAELAVMEQQYLRTPRLRVRAETSGRMRIVRKMREAFEQAGVWELMNKNIMAEPFTYKGDPLKIDCGYENGKVKMFHAVSLAGGVDAAKVLAYSWPQMAEGVRNQQQKDVALTAILEDDLPRSEDSVQFALNTLGLAGIELAAVGEMPLIARVARQDLRA